MRGPDETSGAEPGRLAVPLLLDKREILGHIVESLKDRREGNLIVLREFFRATGLRAMDGFVDHRRSDPSTLEEELSGNWNRAAAAGVGTVFRSCRSWLLLLYVGSIILPSGTRAKRRLPSREAEPALVWGSQIVEVDSHRGRSQNLFLVFRRYRPRNLSNSSAEKEGTAAARRSRDLPRPKVERSPSRSAKSSSPSIAG